MRKLLIGTPIALVILAGAAYWFVNDRARAAVDMRIADLVEQGGYDAVDYESLRVQMNGDIAMTNLHVVQGPLQYTLHDIVVSNLDYTSPYPERVDISIKGLEFSGLDSAGDDPMMAVMAGLLDSLGGESVIPLQVDYSHRYAPANAHQTDSSIRIALPASFTLDMSSVTRNLQMGAFQAIDDSDPAQAQAQLMALLQEAEVPSVSLTLQDQGLLDTMIASAASDSGVSPDDFRRLIVSQLQNSYLFLPENAQALAMDVGAKLAAFLEGGKTLSVSIAPEYNGRIQRLQQEIMGAVFTGDYNQVASLLHFEVATR